MRIFLPQSPISYDILYYLSFSSFPHFWEHDAPLVVITDENVFYKSEFFKNYRHSQPHWLLVIPAGEQHKHWGTIEKIIEKMFQEKLDRNSVVYAVGGGVVGDMVGFASSIFMRGIPFVQVPTTVLSMVDSSVGGKTGIDTPHGKNLIGSFHQPKAVHICADFLDSLPFCEIQNGLSEMVKHSIIANAGFENLQLFAQKYKNEFASQTFSPALKHDLFLLIQQSVLVKKEIVESDEKEQGKRAWLNLGHTFGHAIELLSDFSIPHGLAVAKGMKLALQESEKRGLLQETKLISELEEIFSDFSMNISCLYSLEQLIPAMAHDKKKKDGKIRLILPIQKGEMVLVDL